MGIEFAGALGRLGVGVLDLLAFVEDGGEPFDVVQFLAANPELRVVEDEHVDAVLDFIGIDVVAVAEDFDADVGGEFFGFPGPDIEHGFGADDEGGAAGDPSLFVFLHQPDEVGERLDGFAQAHVIGQDAAEIVGGEVGEELETIDLIGPQGGLEQCGNLGVDFELDIAGAILDALPSLRVEHLGGFGIGELERVHPVGFAGQVEGIEPEAGDRFALVGVEPDFEAHPGAILHPDVTAAGRDELADLGFGQGDALDVDDDAQVEPVDVLAHDFEAHGGGDGVGEDGFEAEVDVEFDGFRHVLDPLREAFGELLGDAGFERENFLVVGEAHVVEDRRHRIEVFAGEAEELLAFDRLLFGEFPAFLGEVFGAAAFGFDGGDIDHEMLGFGGG